MNILSKISKTFLIIVFTLMIFQLISGCGGGEHKVILDFSQKEILEYPEVNKIDSRIALHLTEEFRNYSWKKKGYQWYLNLGDTLSEKSIKVVSEVFQKVIVVKSLSEVMKDEIDAVLVPKIISLEFNHTPYGKTMAFSFVLEWKLKDNNNKILWIDAVRNTTQAPAVKFGWEKALQQLGFSAIQDLFVLSHNKLTTSLDIKEQIYWIAIKKRNTEEAYEEYLKTYPDSKHVGEAMHKLEPYDWVMAQKINTVEAYVTFHKRYPFRKLPEKVHATLETPLWSETLENNTEEAFQEFLKKYPESKYRDLINSNLEKLFWEKTVKNNTKSTYDLFIKTYPDSQYKDKALAKKIAAPDFLRMKMSEFPANLFAVKDLLYGATLLDVSYSWSFRSYGRGFVSNNMGYIPKLAAPLKNNSDNIIDTKGIVKKHLGKDEGIARVTFYLEFDVSEKIKDLTIKSSLHPNVSARLSTQKNIEVKIIQEYSNSYRSLILKKQDIIWDIFTNQILLNNNGVPELYEDS